MDQTRRWEVMRIFFILLVFSYSSESLSSIQKKILQVETSESGSRFILEQAEKQITGELISEMLGEDLYQKQLPQIEKRIYPRKEKFILLTKFLTETKPKEDKKEPPLFITEVLVHFSKETLKKILIQENLFYADQGANRIIALIEFKDSEKRKTYRWWSGSGKSDENLSFLESSNQFYNTLQSIFIQYGFYFIHPNISQSYQMAPAGYKKINPKTARMIAESFSAQMMILGSIHISSLSKDLNQVVWDLSLYNSTHLRELAHHKARIKIPKNNWDFLKKHTDYWGKNFAVQLNSIYQKGVLSTKLFHIGILGNLSFLERQAVKKFFNK